MMGKSLLFFDNTQSIEKEKTVINFIFDGTKKAHTSKKRDAIKNGNLLYQEEKKDCLR